MKWVFHKPYAYKNMGTNTGEFAISFFQLSVSKEKLINPNPPPDIER